MVSIVKTNVINKEVLTYIDENLKISARFYKKQNVLSSHVL